MKAKAMRDIKAMRERMFEPGRVVYEVDYAASAEEFRDKMKALEFAGFHSKHVVDSELGEADGITVPYTLEVKAKSL